MDFQELFLIKDELKQINKTYDIFNEDTRLNWSQAARVEFLLGNTYDHETFKVEDFPFVFFTIDQCRKMLMDGGI